MSYQQFSNINYKKPHVPCPQEGLTILASHICYGVLYFRSLGSNSIQPFYERSKTCTLMLLTNLAEPDWMPISCESRIFTRVVCVNKKPLLQSIAWNNVDTDTKCPLISIVIREKCFYFKWKYEGETMELKLNSLTLNHLPQIKFHHVFDALLLENSHITILTKHNIQTVQYFKVIKYLNKINYKVSNISLLKAEGFFLETLNKIKIIYGITMFRCEAGSFIMSDFVCNQLIDCPYDKSDEENCICSENWETKYCKYIMVGKHKQVCNHLYYTSHSGQCCKYSSLKSITIDNNYHNNYGNCPNLQINALLGVTEDISRTNDQNVTYYNFSCNNGQVISKSLVDDIIPDCGPNAEDEPVLKLLLTKRIYHSCRLQEERPCMIGHKKCFNITDICIYRLNIYHHITPCRNGAHLQSCSKFECNMMFKCTSSYCIPWSYVCNGKWDCPGGHDEIEKYCQKHCRNMYKCVGTQKTCVHVGNVCNRYSECPFGDDEQFCHIQKVICPSVCNCVLHAIQCENNYKNEIIVPHPETYIFIFLFNVQKAPTIITMFHNALYVQLIQSFVTDICNVAHFSSCITTQTSI